MCVFAALLGRIVLWWNFEIESKNNNETKKNFPFGDDDCSRVNSHRASLPPSPSPYQRFGWFESPAVDAALRMIIRPPFWLCGSLPVLPPTTATTLDDDDVGVDDTAEEEGEEEDDEANICRRSWEWT